MSTASQPSDSRPLLQGVPAAHHGRGERILHVDDEPTVTTALRRLLEKLGYRIESFNSPHAAADHFRGTPAAFDLILTDMMMPGMNGHEFAEIVRSHRPELPVVLLSAYAEGHGKPGAAGGPFCEIVLKPAGLPIIAAALRRALERPAAE